MSNHFPNVEPLFDVVREDGESNLIINVYRKVFVSLPWMYTTSHLSVKSNKNKNWPFRNHPVKIDNAAGEVKLFFSFSD